MTKYEKDRLARVQHNEVVLKAYGVPRIVASLKQGAGLNRNVEEKSSKDPGDDEYDPTKEVEVESEDTSEVRIYLKCFSS